MRMIRTLRTRAKARATSNQCQIFEIHEYGLFWKKSNENICKSIKGEEVWSMYSGQEAHIIWENFNVLSCI